MAIRLFLSVLVSLGAACGSGGGGECPSFPTGSCGAEDADARIPFVTPTVVHTGANGRDTYQAVLVANFGDFAVTSSDTGVVCAGRFECLPPNSSGIVAVLTATGAGSATVTVSSGSFRQDVTVEVAGYTPEQYDLGDQRYNSPANVNDGDRIACADCHTGQGGAPHSPLSLAGNSDAELLGAIENSAYPGRCEDDDGNLCDCTPSGTDCGACAGDCNFNDGYVLTLEAFGGGPGEHVYNLTEDERIAILAYMRAIRPEGI